MSQKTTKVFHYVLIRNSFQTKLSIVLRTPQSQLREKKTDKSQHERENHNKRIKKDVLTHLEPEKESTIY